MGPWTNTASDWFDHTLPMITPERAHSIILSTKHNIPAQALFVEYTEKSGTRHITHAQIYNNLISQLTIIDI